MEDWAAAIASGVRRSRRRAARRPGPIVTSAVAVVSSILILKNALFAQEGSHPAPFWGADNAPVTSIVANAPEPERSPLVGSIEEGLARLGYPVGPLDGALDERTIAAIRAFENDRGLSVTGKPSLALLTLLAPPVADEAPAIEPGPEVDVAALQRMLNESGFGPLSVDGVWGPRTREALSRYAATQEGQRLPANLKALVEDS